MWIVFIGISAALPVLEAFEQLLLEAHLLCSIRV